MPDNSQQSDAKSSNEVTHRMGIIAALVKNHETQEALRDGIAEIERLTRERDEAQERFEDMRDVVYNTANVERDHLRAALQKVLAASVPAGYDAGYAVTEAIAREALSGEHQQVETPARHPQGGKGHSQTINGYQIKRLLEFVDGDEECEVEVEWLPERTADDGEKMEAGLYCWLTDYPDEGVLLLDESMPDGAAMAGPPVDINAVLAALEQSPVETSDFQVCLKGPGQCIRPAGHAGECDQVKARGEHD